MSPDQALRSAVEAGRLPGAVWRVEDLDGGFASGAVGLRSRVPEMEATSLDTVYDLASLTKPLATALIAVLLEEEGPVRTFVEQRTLRARPEVAAGSREESRLAHLGPEHPVEADRARLERSLHS